MPKTVIIGAGSGFGSRLSVDILAHEGLRSGTIALVLEAALRSRCPADAKLKFDRLGKPNAAIFEEAVRISGTSHMVMIGDQLDTDIRGANAFGLDSALFLTGMASAFAN